MSTATTTAASTAAAAPQRRTPPLGGFSTTLLGLELRRFVRNRRSVIFTLVMPSAFFLLFGTSGELRSESAGDGTNVTAWVMISMAVYGAMIATTSGGAGVSVERALGWSRQLRLTPLNPIAYVAVKVVVAMTAGLAAVVAVCVVGELSGATIPILTLLECAVIAWLCSVLFAAFGLFMGYLLPSDNVMQVLGPLLALLSFAGGLFVPVEQMGSVFAEIAKWTPVYGVGVLSRAPIGVDGSIVAAVLNVTVWTLLFVAGAVWRLRRDTARV